MTSLSRTTLWRAVQRGELAAPIQLSPNRVAFDAAAVEEWIESKVVSAPAVGPRAVAQGRR
jgi:predicted DNA-binding transcriptional regulator AlpA